MTHKATDKLMLKMAKKGGIRKKEKKRERKPLAITPKVEKARSHVREGNNGIFYNSSVDLWVIST